MTPSTVTTLSGQVADEQIAKWKETHGKVYKYVVDGKVAYLRPVDRTTYAVALSKVSSAGLAKFNEVIVDKTWLGGDDEIRNIDTYFFGLIDHVNELMDKKKGELGEC